jgi:FAD/FMN-containing dehydrogenase
VSDSILQELAAIVGDDNASDDLFVLDTYSRDQSFTSPRRPNYVARPGKAEEVQEIVRMANSHMIPVIPYSSGTNFHGGAVPNHGGILVDLQRMNNIDYIDERNWHALIEPGVTYSQLQAELEKRNLRVATPITSPPSASVLVDYLERNPVITAPDFIFGNELFSTYDIVMPTGELFTIGHPPTTKARASAPDGPALDFYRLFMGAQGTFGIVVRMAIRLLALPNAQKVLFIPADTVERTVEIIQRIERKELGLECFALNSFDLAAILVEDPTQDEKLRKGKYIGTRGAKPWAAEQIAQFGKLRESLPPWTVAICLTSWSRRPEEKLEYQELDIRDLAVELGFEIKNTVGDIPALDKIIMEEVLLPWRMQKRFGYKGSCHGLMFHARPDTVPALETTIYEVASSYHYPTSDIGGYLLPIERARTIYCEYDLHCNLDDAVDNQRVKELYEEVSKVLVDRGAFFDRPYGPWAEVMYSRAGSYTDYLKRVKKQLDPNNILNPGKLCF